MDDDFKKISFFMIDLNQSAEFLYSQLQIHCIVDGQDIHLSKFKPVFNDLTAQQNKNGVVKISRVQWVLRLIKESMKQQQ
jgi:bisphosphoglycerate-independent phosphoglycerate mutase (AlkP superfamily)